MKKNVTVYVALLILSIGVGDGEVLVAASELAGVTGTEVRTADNTYDERMPMVQERGRLLKKRIQRRLISKHSKDDIADISLDTFILFLNREGDKLRRRWSSWSAAKRLEEAMRLAAHTRPTDSDTQDKMDAWIKFQTRLIRESTRPQGAELVFE